MKYLILLISFSAFADHRHHEVNNYETINNYNQINGDCRDAALASAIGNNQMAFGVRKPQLSLGIGSCGGDYAGSLMFGARPCDSCALVNGSISTSGEITTYGVGATFLFK